MKIDDEMLKRITQRVPAPQSYGWVRESPLHSHLEASDIMVLYFKEKLNPDRSVIAYPNGSVACPTLHRVVGSTQESEEKLVEAMHEAVIEVAKWKGKTKAFQDTSPFTVPCIHTPEKEENAVTEKRVKKGFEKVLAAFPSGVINKKTFVLKEDTDVLGLFLYEYSGAHSVEMLNFVLWMQMDMVLALREGIDEALETKVRKTGGQRLYESEVGEFPDSSFDSKRLTWEELGPVLQSKYEDRAQKLGIVAKKEWPEV